MKKLFVLNTTLCPCFLSCCKVSTCAWWTLSFHSRRLWGPGQGSAITRVSNSRWNWAVFSLWRYLHLSHLTFLPWGVRSDHILCLLFVVLPVGLQGVSPPTWLRCTSCHETPIKRFFWAQTAEWVSAGEMCQHWWPVAHQDGGQGAVLDVLGGGKKISVVPRVMVAPAAGTLAQSLPSTAVFWADLT